MQLINNRQQFLENYGITEMGWFSQSEGKATIDYPVLEDISVQITGLYALICDAKFSLLIELLIDINV